jgi:hypothetical protein
MRQGAPHQKGAIEPTWIDARTPLAVHAPYERVNARLANMVERPLLF